MKQVISLDQEYFIKSNFKAKRTDVKSEKGIPIIDYTDDTKQLANGKNVISDIEFHVMESDENGYNGRFRKVYISKTDILKLSKIIEQIESDNVIGIEENWMPF